MNSDLLSQCVEEIRADLSTLNYLYNFERSKRWLRRRWLRRPFYQKKQTNGFYALTFPDLKKDADLFFKVFRMDLDTFYYLLYLTRKNFGILRKRSDGVCAEERLIITLRSV